jgi:hypothetical protein
MGLELSHGPISLGPAMQPADVITRTPGVQKVPSPKLHLFIKRA